MAKERTKTYNPPRFSSRIAEQAAKKQAKASSDNIRISTSADVSKKRDNAKAKENTAAKVVRDYQEVINTYNNNVFNNPIPMPTPFPVQGSGIARYIFDGAGNQCPVIQSGALAGRAITGHTEDRSGAITGYITTIPGAIIGNHLIEPANIQPGDIIRQVVSPPDLDLEKINGRWDVVPRDGLHIGYFNAVAEYLGTASRR